MGWSVGLIKEQSCPLTLSGWVLDGHVLEPQDVLVRQELEKLNLAKGGNGKLVIIVSAVLGRGWGGASTYAILFMMHDDFLQGDKGAGLAQAGAVNLTELSLVYAIVVRL